MHMLQVEPRMKRLSLWDFGIGAWSRKAPCGTIWQRVKLRYERLPSWPMLRRNLLEGIPAALLLPHVSGCLELQPENPLGCLREECSTRLVTDIAQVGQPKCAKHSARGVRVPEAAAM